MRKIILAIAPLIFTMPMLVFAADSTWPTKPVRIIVPFPPGGSLDPIARLAASGMSDALGQSFIVENRPGAAGSIGTAAAAKSAPDGYTFVFVFDTHAVNPHIIKDLPFDTLRDLTPVSLIGTSPLIIATSAAKPYKTIDDVLTAAKKNPKSVNYGTMLGTTGHLAMSQFQKLGAFHLNTIPYKGGAPIIQDLIGGQLDLSINTPTTIMQYIRSHRVKPLAVTGARRINDIPNTPTLAEAGYPGLEIYSWWAVLAPAGTPPGIVAKFQRELQKAFNQPVARKQLEESLGIDVVTGSPEHLDKWIRSEMDRWKQVVKENAIVLE